MTLAPIHTFLILICLVVISACSSGKPDSRVNGNAQLRTIAVNECEDCELIFLDMPAKVLPVDTSDGWFEKGQQLIVRGLVVENDLTTPASDVIVYYYHTDQTGIYATDETTRGSRKHGRLRGWVKTDQNGRFWIYTSRPAQYPSNNTEAHIHVIVKEPDMRDPYWIDAWVFDDDPLLTPSLRNRLENRGGSGIMEIKLEGDIQVANQKIILGQNVPGYPK